jgi:hypothetical protein
LSVVTNNYRAGDYHAGRNFSPALAPHYNP